MSTYDMNEFRAHLRREIERLHLRYHVPEYRNHGLKPLMLCQYCGVECRCQLPGPATCTVCLETGGIGIPQ